MKEHFKHYLQKQIELSDDQFELISPEVLVKTIKKGTIVMQQNTIDDATYFVTKGLLRAYTIDEHGKEHIIQFAPENWWLNDKNSFYFGEPSLFFIEAVEDTEVIYLTKQFFDTANHLLPCFAAWNTVILHNSIRFMQKRINLLLSATAEARYLDFMKLYPNLMFRVPQTMIASYLGITPESLSRVRKALATKHV
ncbi:MAG: Crp/Fnr family transcriptional regulator [Spirosomataceae bacterium]|jgi:CRP-like cAMP-binding protein